MTTELDKELQRVAEREPVVHAWVHRQGDAAIRQAVTDAPEGPLRGWTLGVKDIIDTFDLPTECGSPALRGRRPSADAACVALARAAGAVVVGKTVTTEFAVLTPAETRNPVDLNRTPGGSSSGSAAAVADGMVRVALGTQTAGSVIRPASFCGIWAFKPTAHLVAAQGVHQFSPSLDTVGWFARSSADLTALLEVLAAGSIVVNESQRPPRIGLYRSHQWDKADGASQQALMQIATRLRNAGAEVLDVPPEPAFATLADAQSAIMFAEGYRSLAWAQHTYPELLSNGLRALLAQGAAVTASEYGAAQAAALVGRACHQELLGTFDALLTPAAIGEAPLSLKKTGDPLFSRTWNLLGAPCVNVPGASGEHGMPIGVQLVGALWQDGALATVAQWVSAALARTAPTPD